MQVEELILCSHSSNLDSGPNTSRTHRETEDVNESLFSWIQRDYLYYQTGSGFGQSPWAEWDLVEALLM